MKKRTFKAIICVVLGAMLVTSLTACGGNEISVDDYGDATDMAKAADKDTDKDTDKEDTSPVKTTGNTGQSFRDVYGESVKIEESFSVGNTAINPSFNVNIPDETYPKVYKSKLLDDGKADEEKLVNSILKDVKKLDEIAYEGGSDYVTMIDKYRSIMISHEYAKLDPSTQLTDPLELEQQDPKEGVYKWTDDSDIYIHMYEGKYNNVRFGLLLAYDYMRHEKTIFMEPISINEYYSSGDYNTLIVEGSKDSAGNEKEFENACSYTNEEALEIAKEFLDSKLGLGNGITNLSSGDSLIYQMTTGGVASTTMGMATGDPYKDDSYSVLTFSDSVLSVDQYHERDIIKWVEALQYTNEKSENPNYYTDGYAFFLNPLYPSNLHSFMNYEFISGNYGMVKVTGNGIYGVDLTLVSEVTEIVNDVNVLDFDKIEESFKNNLQNELDVTKLNVPINANHLEIHFASLLYYPYFEKEDVTEFSYIPAWDFSLSSMNGHSASVVVNALDGTIVEIIYQ